MLTELLVCLALSSALWTCLSKGHTSDPPLPPGPPRLPLLGNIAHAPAKRAPQWLFWRKHIDKYGPISSIEIFGRPIIILNSAEAAIELMERGSAVTRWVMDSTFIKMCGWAISQPTPANQAFWKGMRTNMKREIGSKGAVAHWHAQMDLSNRRLLAAVDAIGFILSFTYGYTVKPQGHDPFYDLVRKAVEHFEVIVTSHSRPVNYFPLLQYLPVWFPGAAFVRKAAELNPWSRLFTTLPYKFVKYKMAQSDYQPSMLSKLLQNEAPEPGSREETMMMWSTAELYIGGADTSASQMTSFAVAMALYPEVQRKAQEELDRVVGYARLPGFEHRADLVYIEALVKENLRWRPPGPVSDPHVAEEDLLYNGYVIPKGSLLLPILGSFSQDSKTYKDPEPIPRNTSSGFGRRVCPGRFLADDRLFLYIAQFIACFNIAPADPNAPAPEWLPGPVSHPEPFALRIEPRSNKHVRLVRAVETETPWVTTDAEDFERLTK
ncbi:cytochrome P450 [Aspergillus heterothallicus]